MAWNEGQQKAIDARAGHYLVSAGAGSGKTAVLTERIHSLVEEGACSLNELLVLTFTNKAAGEMKERVRQAFKDDPQKASQVESAAITTFDAFALSLVKKYHFSLHLDSDIQILDEGLLLIEKRKILDQILLERYAEKDPIFEDFVKHYAIKDDDAIVGMTLKLLDFAELSGDKAFFFAHALDHYYDPAFIDDSLIYYSTLMKLSLGSMIEATKSYDNTDMAAVEEAFLAPLAACASYGELYTHIVGQTYPRKPSKKDDDSLTPLDNALHTSLGQLFNSLRNDIANFGPEDEEKKRIEATKPYVKIFLSLAAELDARLSAYKEEKGAYAFADIAYLASKVASDPLIQSELRGQYRYVMVDEYQDTSDLQERFLEAIVEKNFFAVGDIKQSIYRFRNANPTIFHAYEDTLKEKAPGCLISLQTNYRSREEVLFDINAIFANLMSQEFGDVDYRSGQALTYGNTAFSPSAGEEHHLSLLNYDVKKGLSADECEARVIAEDIKEKLQSGYQVLAKDKVDKSRLRPCEPQDFAILIARKRAFQTYAKVFAEAKLPLAISDDEDLSSQDVSALFLSCLRLPCVIDADVQAEKHCFASIMRSYLFAMSDEDIFEAIQSKNYRKSPLFEETRKMKKALLEGECEAGVSYWLDTYPFFDCLPRIGDVKDNYERIASFLTYAKQFDHLGGSYADFVAHFAEMKRYQVEFTLSAGSDSGDSVHLMSIHASKGLQFPIVYSPDMDAKVNLRDASNAFMVNPSGIEIPLTMEEGNPYNVWHDLAANDEGMAAISERVRLFYVALTRAEEKIIVVEEEKKNLEIRKIDATNILKITYKTDPDGNDKSKAVLAGPKSFREFLALSAYPLKGEHRDVLSPLAPYRAYQAEKEVPLPVFKSVRIPAEALAHERASKASLEPLDEGALAYGTKLHRLLQLVDFKTKDVSFISSLEDRAKIARVLALPLFADVAQAEVYPEYGFYDEKEGVHGSIDLLLIYPTKAVVIDYKAKSIDDPAYAKQVGLYAAYVKRAFAKECETYLLSIIDGRSKRV
jgi:ATP-dependent helicase/nuclease subunit A